MAIVSSLNEKGRSLKPTDFKVNENLGILYAKTLLKFNLEVYILVENILRTCKEALLWGQSPVEACNKYIEMASKKDIESFEVLI